MERVTDISTWCYICNNFITQGVDVNDVTHFDVICDECAKKIANIYYKDIKQPDYVCTKCGKVFDTEKDYLAHFKENCVVEQPIEQKRAKAKGKGDIE